MNKIILAVKLIGLFLTIYALASIPLYTSYYYAAGNLNAKFFFLIVLLPCLLTLIMSIFCILKAETVGAWVVRNDSISAASEEAQANNNSLLMKGATRLLSIYLFFIAVSDLAYGTSYLMAVQNMVDDASYLDPEGLGKVVAATVEFIAALVIAKIKWFE